MRASQGLLRAVSGLFVPRQWMAPNHGCKGVVSRGYAVDIVSVLRVTSGDCLALPIHNAKRFVSEPKDVLESRRRQAALNEASKHLLRMDSDQSMKWTAMSAFRSLREVESIWQEGHYNVREDAQVHAVE